MINGGGLTWEIAKIRAIEVRARSPPESIMRPRIFFLGRLTLISRPSSTFSSSSSISPSSNSDFLLASLVRTRLASPPPNMVVKSSSNFLLILSSPEANSTASLVSNSLISSAKVSADFSRSKSSRAKNVSRSEVALYSLCTSS